MIGAGDKNGKKYGEFMQIQIVGCFFLRLITRREVITIKPMTVALFGGAWYTCGIHPGAWRLLL